MSGENQRDLMSSISESSADWFATHSTGSANKGLDMEMPGNILPPISFFGPSLGEDSYAMCRVTVLLILIL